ncbi:IGF-like family receptor 1 [Alligator mississippiensis]|uniref:IGF-like family receptor 1 n=1 Tax=Alligator mississippiensis TaxID=8496 RepID=A0A151NR74_ALLMI|nr:IGF-like family receptor 1 [Alligator mississippiensis]
MEHAGSCSSPCPSPGWRKFGGWPVARRTGSGPGVQPPSWKPEAHFPLSADSLLAPSHGGRSLSQMSLLPVAKQPTPQTRSARCRAEDFWDKKQRKCERCAKQYAHYLPLIGQEFNVNCGHRDGGGRNMAPVRPCPAGTSNDGSFLWCQPSQETPRNIVRIPQSSPQPHTEAPSHPTSVSSLQGPRSTMGIPQSSPQPHTEAPSRPTSDASLGRTLSPEFPGGAAIPLVLILLLVALVGVALVVALLLVAAWRKRKSAPGPGAGLELVAEVESEPEVRVGVSKGGPRPGWESQGDFK